LPSPRFCGSYDGKSTACLPESHFSDKFCAFASYLIRRFLR
jgi:hypothetical protein